MKRECRARMERRPRLQDGNSSALATIRFPVIPERRVLPPVIGFTTAD
jgi:hypothetical protein